MRRVGGWVGIACVLVSGCALVGERTEDAGLPATDAGVDAAYARDAPLGSDAFVAGDASAANAFVTDAFAPSDAWLVADGGTDAATCDAPRTCTVLVDAPTAQAAIDDPCCARIELANTETLDPLVIWRDVTIVGPGATSARTRPARDASAVARSAWVALLLACGAPVTPTSPSSVSSASPSLPHAQPRSRCSYIG